MPISGVSSVISAIYTTGAEQVLLDNIWAIINYETKVQDTHNAITTGVAWKFEPPVAGFYIIIGKIFFASTTAWEVAERGALAVFVNGARVALLDYRGNFESTEPVFLILGGSLIVYLEKDDYLDIRGVQNTGGSLALHESHDHSYFNVIKYAGV